MAEKKVVHCRCHRMILPAGGGRSALAQGLTHYCMKERVAPSNRLRSFGPVTNQGTVAKYLSQVGIPLAGYRTIHRGHRLWYLEREEWLISNLLSESIVAVEGGVL
jgi:hypothetical protein